jgi:hypothetical protein
VGGPKAPRPLPCLNTNNSTEPVWAKSAEKLTSVHRKTAFALAENVRAFSDRFGIERLGFLTLTFADHVTDAKEAGRRFNSLATHVLNVRYEQWIRVIERHKSGRIHFHVLVVIDTDIRTGVDFSGFARAVYTSAGAKLRSEWAFWRNTARNYGFGRTELLPVKSTAEGIARYVGKYIAKHIEQREQSDKGVRLVSYSKGARRANSSFTWRTPGADLWRFKLGLFCSAMGATSETYNTRFKAWFGSKWVFHLGQVIEEIRLPVYPTAKHFLCDYPGREVPAGSVDIAIRPLKAAHQSIAKAVLTAEQVRRNYAERNKSKDAAEPQGSNVETRRVSSWSHLGAISR